MSMPTLNQTALILTSSATLAYLFDAPPSKLLRGVQLGALLSSAAAVYNGVNAHNQPANKRVISSRTNPALNLDTLRTLLTRKNLNIAVVSALTASVLIATGVIKAPAKIQNLARVVVGLTIAVALWHVKKNNPSRKLLDQTKLQEQFLASLPIPTAHPVNQTSRPLPMPSVNDFTQLEADGFQTHLLLMSEAVFERHAELNSLQEYAEAGSDITEDQRVFADFLDHVAKKNGPIANGFRESINTVLSSLTQLKEARQENFTKYLLENYEPNDMGGEGDCFPRAALGCFDERAKVDEDHSKLRKTLVQIMKDDRTKYEPLIESRLRGENPSFKKNVQNSSGNDDFEKYLNYMKKDGSYCGNPEAEAAASFFQRPIVFLQRVSKNNHCANTVTPRKTVWPEPMAILNLMDGHFQTLRPKPPTKTK